MYCEPLPGPLSLIHQNVRSNQVVENTSPTADLIRMILCHLARVHRVDDPCHIAALISGSSYPLTPFLSDGLHPRLEKGGCFKERDQLAGIYVFIRQKKKVIRSLLSVPEVPHQ
jgi:hypothetical protein